MKVYKKSMTLSEILFSLTIIGVIAAITLPTLRGNINERTWKAQRKALYSRISQAIPLGGALNGYGIGNDDTQTKTNAAQAFILQRLKKNIQMNNVCEKNKISDCGISSKIFTLNGSQISFPTTMLGLNPLFSHSNIVDGVTYSTGVLDTDVAAFETINGDSVAVFYNPNCGENIGIYDLWNYIQPLMCVNFIYDLNGPQGPNTVGKDIGFITALYPTNTNVVSPKLSNTKPSGAYTTTLLTGCNLSKSEIAPPNKEEIFSMFYNNALINITGSSVNCLYSVDSSTELAAQAYDLDLASGKWQKVVNTTSCMFPCIDK